MTPLKFARDECANYNKDGSCLGVRLEDLISPLEPWDPGHPKRFLNSNNKCLLNPAYHKNKRCRYFEKMVLPIADWPSPVDEPNLQLKRQEARNKYYAKRGIEMKKTKQRLCACGATLEKRKRMCPRCRAEKARESKRRWIKEKRVPCRELTVIFES